MLHRAALATLLLVIHVLPGAAWAVTPAVMKTDIEARYRITTMDALGFLKESGSVLILRKEGLRADRPGAFNKANVISAGKVIETGGAGVPLGGGLDGRLKQGERLRLHGVMVDDRGVELNLFTVKSFVVTGSRSPIPLQAIVRFRYDEGLATLTGHQVLGDLDAWLGSENTLRISKTVRQGQSPEEVVTILGEPEKKVLLDEKTVFIYSDMRLVFRDGRLVDLE